MSPIDKLPNLDWTELAREQIITTGADLVARSDFAYQIRQIAIAGLIYHSYVSPPWFWFALAKGVTIRDLADLNVLKHNIPKGALTAIDDSWPHVVRFAQFYGFEDTGESRNVDGKLIRIFRRT